jgi:outer membrane protein assembly factor BamD (BamD/ComL family)
MKVPVAVVLFAVALLAAGCSKPGPKELYRNADKAEASAITMLDSVRDEAKIRQAFAPALEDFHRIVENFPADTLAEVALFRSANIRNNYTHESREAINDFKTYVERYPKGRQTEMAMFLIGFVYNNSLHQIDSAGAAYRRFLERYPESQYATAAQYELNSLGKSPDELLPPPAPLETPKKAAAPKPSKVPT